MGGHLLGKVIINGTLKALSGLHIGGPREGLKIGGVDNPVIRDPEGKPYIPGSSLKGKLRTLLERHLKVQWNENGSHECENKEEYKNCPVCKIFGIMKEFEETFTLTRLIVRDCYLDEDSLKEIKENLPLEYTESKYENAINRITGRAISPRQFERVPPGAEFKDLEFILSIFDNSDVDLLKHLFIAMQLLEDDYLGGMGTRGYGKVKFKDLKIYWNKNTDYENGSLKENIIFEGGNVKEFIKVFDNIKLKFNTDKEMTAQ